MSGMNPLLKKYVEGQMQKTGYPKNMFNSETDEQPEEKKETQSRRRKIKKTPSDGNSKKKKILV